MYPYGLTSATINSYRLTMPKHQVTNLEQYHSGVILQNASRGVKQVITFKFRGNQYSSNYNRTRQYCLDDKWKPVKTSLLTKLRLIATGKVHRLNPSKKALLAGV